MRLPIPFFLICIAAGISSHAQLPFFSTSLTEADGLSSNYIQSMEWDRNNRLWIGTDKGISIYDGHRFSNIDSHHGLNGSYISQLLFDSIGQSMLIITSNRKLYSSKNQRLTFIPLPAGYTISHIGIAAGNLYQVVADAPGNRTAYFITREIRSLPYESPVFQIDNSQVASVAFGAGREIIVYDKLALEKGHSHVSPGVHITQQPSTAIMFNAPTIDDTIIVTTDEVDWARNGKHIKIRAHAQKQWMYGAALTVDNQEAIVLRDYNSGNILCIKENGSHVYLPDSVTKLPAITQILKGPDNSLLIATMGQGVIICYPSKGKVMLAKQNVVRIAPAANGCWLVADNHLYHYNKTSYPKPTGIELKSATSITEIGNTLHCTSLLKYDRYSLHNNTPQPIYSRISTAGISGFNQLSSGNYELSSYSFGVEELNQHNQVVDTLSRNKKTLHDDIIEKIIPLRNGRAFTSFGNGVLIKYEKGKDLLLNDNTGLLSNTVYHVTQEKNTAGLWICSEDGVTNFVNGTCINYSYAQGFKGKKCLYEFKDKKGRVFIASDMCLMQLENGKLLPLQSYPIKPSKNAIISTLYFDAASQKLYVGSSEGLFELDIATVQPNTSLLKPAVYYIKTSDSIININRRSVFISNRTGGMKIVCGFKEVDFEGLSKLYYKLEGWNSEWEPVPANFSIIMPQLAAGVYELKMYAVNEDGLTSRPETMLIINKLYPWYLSRPLRILYALLIAGTVWIVAQVWVRNRIRQRIRHLLIGQQLQHERDRISAELHDNVGSQLTNIIAHLDYVEMALQHQNQNLALQKVKGLQGKARQAMNQLRESIWILKEEALTLPAFVSRVHRYAIEIFDDESGVNFDITNAVESNIVLTPWQAVNLLRILQEGFQNIQKHSGASNVELEFSDQNSLLLVVLSDNGMGFSAETVSQRGLGLNSMQRRIKEMNGSISIHSEPQDGTSIRLEVPVNNKS